MRKTTCTKCGAESYGSAPGQKHRKCPGRSWAVKPGFHIKAGKEVFGPGVVKDRGIWE